MSQIFKVRIPTERIGALIGQNGDAKRRIESDCQVKLIIDSETGEVDICPDKSTDPTLWLKAQSIVSAVGRGFSPEKACRLLDDDVALYIIDLREFTRSRGDIARIKGRIIGRDGKTRRIIEETTNVDVSVYGHSVSLIGKQEELEVAKEAVEKFLKGSQHKTVYRFLGLKRHEMKKEEFKLWEA